jgi:hypothetical protein
VGSFAAAGLQRLAPSGLGRLRSNLAFALWLLLAAFLIAGAVASEQWQGVLTFVLVVASGALYLRHPVPSLAILIGLWSFSPFLRRVIDYASLEFGGSGMLSLAPFLATALVGLLATIAVRPPRYLVVAAALVLAGIVVGVPQGMSSPLSVVFGVFAYGSAVLALFIGYAEERCGRRSLEMLLMVALVPLTAYGLWQYFATRLPAWDNAWVVTSGIKSVGSKENGNLSVFSMLNSPATFAAILVVFLVGAVVAGRVTPVRVVLGGAALACLALTNIRTSWISLGVALILVVLLSGGRALGRVLLLAAIGGALFVALGGTGATDQIVSRANTFGDVKGDSSVSARIDQVKVFGPRAVQAPLGHGLGSVGQAARAREGFAPFDDNGLLMLMYQVGPLGFLLVMGPMLWLLLRSLRARGPTERTERLPLVAPVVATLVILLGADALYGITAFVAWYCLGALAARWDMTRAAPLLSTPQARPALSGAR